MNPRFNQVLSSSAEDRRDLFVTSARRLGTNERNLEKDFWVCWTLDALFHELPDGGPRLLFKGGTSLSKAFGLIFRRHRHHGFPGTISGRGRPSKNSKQ